MTASSAVISPDALLAHWQGHRRLTRRVINAFPDDALFTFSIGGMRSFGEMAMEILTMAVPMVDGVLTGKWATSMSRERIQKQELLTRWDATTARLDELWPRIPLASFQQEIVAFGQYPGKVHDLLLYVIDNEIHHRGEGYVYLRAQGIEPPAFPDRS